jgi:hypothetical protein
MVDENGEIILGKFIVQDATGVARPIGACRDPSCDPSRHGTVPTRRRNPPQTGGATASQAPWLFALRFHCGLSMTWTKSRGTSSSGVARASRFLFRTVEEPDNPSAVAAFLRSAGGIATGRASHAHAIAPGCPRMQEPTTGTSGSSTYAATLSSKVGKSNGEAGSHPRRVECPLNLI